MDTRNGMRVDLPGELPEPTEPLTAIDILNKKDGFDVHRTDQQMIASGVGSSSASSCSTARASSAGLSLRLEEADAACSGRRSATS